MADLLDNAVIEIAEELSQVMGLTIPAPEMVKVAGAMVATETVKSALDLLIPSASSAMSFSTTGWKNLTMPRMLCNGNGAISHLQTKMGFIDDFSYSLYNW